jgi:hypothetical protein
LQPAQRAVGAHERFLHGIRGVVRIAQQHFGQQQRTTLMRTNQRLEGGGAAVAAPKNQFPLLLRIHNH